MPVGMNRQRTITALREVSGGLGDLGAFLPLTLALAAAGAISFPAAVAFAGVAHLITAVRYPLPMAVQPMKAIAAAGIATPAAAAAVPLAGIVMGVLVTLLALGGALSRLQQWIPMVVVRGMQLGVGAMLALRGSEWVLQNAAGDGPVWLAVAAIIVGVGLFTRLPAALLVCVLGGVMAVFAMGSVTAPAAVATVDLSTWAEAAPLVAAQLPMTLLNSVVAVVVLARDLFPDAGRRVTGRGIGLIMGPLNLIGPWFGAMPICHGSGGLAAQYRFGARTRWSIVALGVAKMGAVILFGGALATWAAAFPLSLLGLLLIVAGAELGRHGLRVRPEEGVIVGGIALGVVLGHALVAVTIAMMVWYGWRRWRTA